MSQLFNEELVKSAILGFVVGDALGVPVEFMTRNELVQAPVTGMRSGGTHHQPAGTWSDDSSMTLCTLESLVYGLDYQDIMRKFHLWAKEGYWTAHGEVFDMGITTQEALDRYAHGTTPLKCGSAGFYDNGNGSLMRILPIVLYLFKTTGRNYNTSTEAYEIIHRVSALTHAHPISCMACGIYCSIACELLSGHNTVRDIQSGIQRAKDFYCSQPTYSEGLSLFERIHTDVLCQTPSDHINSSGYVVDTLEASLWCLLHTENYRSCVLTAVNLGGDTDTVAAIAGGLAGIRYGLSDIPDEWLSCIARKADIEALCNDFCSFDC